MSPVAPKSVSSPAVIDVSTPTNKSLQSSFTTPVPNEQHLRTIELSSGRIREGFGIYILLFYAFKHSLVHTIRHRCNRTILNMNLYLSFVTHIFGTRVRISMDTVFYKNSFARAIKLSIYPITIPIIRRHFQRTGMSLSRCFQ